MAQFRITGVRRYRAWTAAVAAALAVTVLAAIGVFLAVPMSQKPLEPQTLSGFGGHFTLIDQEGRAVTDADFHGRWVLLYFGYTHCPDVCPTAVNAIAEALDELGPMRKELQALFITLDPERDTPVVLKDYTSAFHAGILGLTGTPEQVGTVAGEYRISYEKHAITENSDYSDYSIDHTSVIFLVDPQGRPVSMFSHEVAPDQLAQRLREDMR